MPFSIAQNISVPMDYNNPTGGEVTLALARHLATNVTHRLGTLMFNPGGPGASGVTFIRDNALDMSKLLDGRYDIVSPPS